MKRKKIFAVLTSVVLAMSMTVTALAGTHNVGSPDELRGVFNKDTDADVEIILTGDIKMTYYDRLVAQEGQIYTINGHNYVLSNVTFGGSGEVIVNGDITGVGRDAAALTTQEGVSVTVNGNVTATDAYAGVNAEHYDRPVQSPADGGEKVSVDPDENNSTVVINGDVSGGEYGVGIYAEDNADITVNGNVEDGVAGIVAADDAQISVNSVDEQSGNVTDFSEVGIQAEDNSSVSVDGNVIAAEPDATDDKGDDTTDGDTDGTLGGIGIIMDSTADVSVGGDVTGGSGVEDTYAGTGALVVLQLNEVDDEGNLVENTSGKLVVGGTITGGTFTDSDGSASAITYDDLMNDDSIFIRTREIDDMGPEVVENEIVYVYEGNVSEGIAQLVKILDPDNEEKCEEYVSLFEDSFMDIFISTFGKEALEQNEIEELLEQLDADEQKALLVSIVDLYNTVIYQMLDEYNIILTPEITVWGLRTEGDTDLYTSDYGDVFANVLGAEVNYTVRITDIENGSLTVDRPSAKAGETVTVTPKANDGYKTSKVYLIVDGTSTELTAGEDGVYSFIMPEGGTVEVSAAFDKKEDTVEPPVDTKTPADTKPTTSTSTKQTSSTTTKPITSTIPQTGDSSHMMAWGTVMLGAFAVLVIGVRRKMSENKR